MNRKKMLKRNKKTLCRIGGSKSTVALLSCLFLLLLGIWGPGVLAEEAGNAEGYDNNTIAEDVILDNMANESDDMTSGEGASSLETDTDSSINAETDAANNDSSDTDIINGAVKTTQEAAELLVEASLTKYNYYTSWKDKWGTYPDDGTNPDDYVYYIWKLSCTVTGAESKYTLTLDLGTTEDSAFGIIEGPGEIMGWRRGALAEFTGEKGHDYSAGTLTRSTPTAEAKTTNMYVLTRIPRDEVPVEGAAIKVKGKVNYSDVSGVKKNIEKDLNWTCKANHYLVSNYNGPANISITKEGDQMTVNWDADPRNDSYTVSYSTTRLFYPSESIQVDGRYADSVTMSGLDPNKTYYVRIRAYKTFDGVRYTSKRAFSENVTNAFTIKKTAVKYNGERFELRQAAGQKMMGYDTVQAGCTDGTYAYFTLYNRDKNNCKAAKVDLSTMEVVKVSGKLGCRHGNGMAYDPKNNRLYITHTTNEPRKITIVDADTLKVISRKTINIPEDLPGNTSYQKSVGHYFSSISYNPTKKRFVVLLRTTGRFLILNSKLEPLRIVKPSKNADALRQGLNTYRDYIMVLSSPYKGYPTNRLTLYDWDGSYVTTVTISGGYELENTFVKDDRVYVTSYHSYYKSYEAKVKKVKKIKKKNKSGKYYYVKKTYYETVTKQKLLRDNYIYRLYKL